MNWISLLSAFGFGSVVSVIAQWYFSNRMAIQERKYRERKEAYIGLLESWANQDKSEFAPHTSIDVGHWHLRATLVASKNVHLLLMKWMELTPGSDERIKVTNDLKEAMRSDLRNF